MTGPKDIGEYDLSTLGGRFKAARIEANLTQADVFRISGVSMATIGRVEQDKPSHNTGRATLEKLAAAVNCGFNWLMSGEGMPPPGVASGLAEWDDFTSGPRGNALSRDERRALYRLATSTIDGTHISAEVLVVTLTAIRGLMGAKDGPDLEPLRNRRPTQPSRPSPPPKKKR